MSKIRRKLRNLLRPWGPCPYHLPPRNQSPWTPPPEPLYPPPPHRVSFKKKHFSSFCTKKYNASSEICSVPGARAPTTYPPGTEALGPPLPSPCTPPPPHRVSFKNDHFSQALAPPPSPSLGPRGGPRGLLSPLLWNCHPAPTPTPNQGPWFTALSTRPAPVGNPPTPQGILQKTSFFFFNTLKNTTQNLLRPWGPCPYHLPPRNHSPWTPPPEPLYAPPPDRVSFKKHAFCTR